MITLKKDSLPIKIFQYAYKHWNTTFFDREDYKWKREPKDTTNICQFIRYVFLALPFMFLFNIGIITVFVCVFINLYPSLITATIVYAFPFVVFGVVFGLSMILGWLEDKISNLEFYKNRPVKETVPNPNPGFFKIIWQFIKDRHAKVCSIIKIEE